MKGRESCLFAALLCACCVGAAEFNAVAIANRLRGASGRTASGEDPVCGLWVVAIGSANATSLPEKDAMAAAALNARTELAGFLTAQISATTEMTQAKDGNGTKSTFSRWTRSNVSELLRGVRVEECRIEHGQALATAVLTERTLDASNVLRRAMREERPGTVEAVGEGPTLEAACAAAQRSALEQVCGISVVASDAVTEDGVRSRAFTDVQGMVAAYRILEQKRTGNAYRVRIVAEIDREELRENYGAQMKAMGDPLFWLTSTNDDALRQMSDWFIGKGLKTTLHQGTADYKVSLLTKFERVTHPMNKRVGTRLQLTAVCCDKAGVQLFSLQNDPRKAVSFVGSAERQAQIAVEKAIGQFAPQLHERLQRAIADLTNNGRTVRLVFRNVKTAEQCAAIEALAEVINELPGASSATYSRNDAVAVSTLRLTLKGNPQDFLGVLRSRTPNLPPALTVSANKIVFEL